MNDDLDAALVESLCRAVRDRTGDLDGLLDQAVRELAPLATSAERAAARRSAHARLAGLDGLEPLLSDPDVDEVLVNGEQVWVDRGGRIEPIGPLTGASVEQLIERILAPIGRRVDRTSPIVDARLANGSRVCAVVPPVAVGGAALSIRRFARAVRPLDQFTDDIGIDLLDEIVSHRCNVIVCGATSSGKTSLLASMLHLVAEGERLLLLEDTAELPCDAEHLVRLEARPANADGLTEVSVADLVVTALRMRPDRLVLGEVRSNECLALMQAMNTGHDGSFSTCHANGPLDALLRLESLVLQAAPQWPLLAVRRQLSRSVDVIVHVDRVDGRRRVASVSEVRLDSDADSAVTELGSERCGRFERRAELTRVRR